MTHAAPHPATKPHSETQPGKKEEEEGSIPTPENSTNGRTEMSAPAWLRAIFGAAGILAPSLAAAAAARLFTTTQRRSPKNGERDVLRAATRFEVERMVAWSWGEGPVVLLVHGWNGRATQLGGFVQPLVDRGYRVVAFDALGHGESPGRQNSLPELATAIRTVADAAGGVHAVIAHSLGAAATALALFDGMDARRLVFVSPPSDPRRFFGGFAKMLGLGDAVEQEAARRLERRVGRPLDEVNVIRLAERLSEPLLIVHDRNDAEVPWEAGRTIAETWRGAVLYTTDGLGHHRILRDPAVQDVAARFIDAPNHSARHAA